MLVYLVFEDGGGWDDSYRNLEYATTDEALARAWYQKYTQDIQAYKNALKEGHPGPTPHDLLLDSPENTVYADYTENTKDRRIFLRGELGRDHKFYRTTGCQLQAWEGTNCTFLESVNFNEDEQCGEHV
jgi:hypothetical protein